jgi:hypothetical protein
MNNLSSFLEDCDQYKIYGYEHIELNKSTELLNSPNIKLGTYIIRPSSHQGSYEMDIKGENEIYNFTLQNEVREFVFAENIKADCVTDLIAKIKKMDLLPNTQMQGSSLTPYILNNA